LLSHFHCMVMPSQLLTCFYLQGSDIDTEKTPQRKNRLERPSGQTS
jgi:hypothetical protein